jgi:putative Mn2+ efflux pump MntP
MASRNRGGLRRHDIDVFALMAGLVFLVLGAGWALNEAAGLDVNARWTVPVLLIGLGVVGLAGSFFSRRDDVVQDDET